MGASQYLFDFGRRRGFVRERRFEAAEADQQQRLVSLDLVLEVSQRYFDLLRAKQLVRVFEKAVEERQFHLHAAEIKAKAGLRPHLDVYVTQAEVQRARLHLVDAQNSESDCVVALDNALGLGGRNPSYQLTDVLSYPNITDSMELLLRTAFQLRPDFASLRDQAQAMGAQVAEYRSDYFPTAEAVGGYSAMGTGLPAANNFNVGIVITWPIFNSFLTSHQVAAAKFRQRAVQSQIEDLRQRIVLQVKTAFLDWQASLQRINRAAQTRAASQAELELAEKRYNAGLTDIVELEDAQRNYTDDDAAYANALYGYSIAKANADYATGRSLSTESRDAGRSFPCGFWDHRPRSRLSLAFCSKAQSALLCRSQWYEAGYLPITRSAVRSGVSGICTNPVNGCSSSRIRKIAPATDIALTISVVTAVAFRGANKPKLMKRILSQKTTTTRNGVETVVPFCSKSSQRVWPSEIAVDSACA